MSAFISALLPDKTPMVPPRYLLPKESPEAPALEAPDAPFDNLKTPLAEPDFMILAKNGYRYESDGTFHAQDSARSLGATEVQVILSDLWGRQRLQAMLELNLIFNQHGTKNLPADAREDLRRIGRQNWAVLPDRIRQDLRPFFEPYELAALSQGRSPARVPRTWLPPEGTLPPPDPLPEPAASAPADPVPLPAPWNPVVAFPPGAVSSALPPQVVAALAAQLKPQAPSSPVVEAPGQFAAAQAPPMRLQVAQNPLPVANTAPGTTGKENILPVAATPAPVPPPLPAVPPVPVAPGAVFAPGAIGKENNLPIEPADLKLEELDRFLAEAPYGREAKTFIRLIHKHAPADVRRPALGVLTVRLPMVVLAPARAGVWMRSSTHQVKPDESQPAAHAIALDPGPVLATKDKLLFGGDDFLIPDSLDYYQSLGVPAPGMQAVASPASADRERDSDWGRLRGYPDGSRRLKYSQEQLAGTLLRELLLLDASRRGWKDAYRTELLARSGEFRFYRALKAQTGAEAVLDPALKAEYNEWLRRPEDFMDRVLQSLASPARRTVLPALSPWADGRRRDLQLLQDAGLVSKADARKVLQGLPAPPEGAPEVDESQLEAQRQALDAGSPAAAAWVASEQRNRSEADASK